MKKSCALALAGFYLVITTSVYTCLVHCTTKYLFSTLGIVQQIHQTDKDHEKEKKDDNDEDCNNADITHLVRTNLNSSFNFQSAVIPVTLLRLKNYSFYYLPKHAEARAKWAPANGPPLYI